MVRFTSSTYDSPKNSHNAVYKSIYITNISNSLCTIFFFNFQQWQGSQSNHFPHLPSLMPKFLFSLARMAWFVLEGIPCLMNSDKGKNSSNASNGFSYALSTALWPLVPISLALLCASQVAFTDTSVQTSSSSSSSCSTSQSDSLLATSSSL